MKKQGIFGQKITGRIISIMLALCLLIGLAPVTEFSAAAVAPTAIPAVLTANSVEKGGTAKLTSATVTYSSVEETIATVNLSGIVTGVLMGKTTITVTAEYIAG